MNEYTIKARIVREICVAYYSEDDDSDELCKYSEGQNHSLMGSCFINDNEEIISISLLRDRKKLISSWLENRNITKAILDEKFVFDENSFFKEATRENIAGLGEILAREDRKDHDPFDVGHHLFAVVVSDELFHTILRYCDLALGCGLGKLKCELSIPDRFTRGGKFSFRKLPIGELLPITSFYFNYDSGRTDTNDLQ